MTILKNPSADEIREMIKESGNYLRGLFDPTSDDMYLAPRTLLHGYIAHKVGLTSWKYGFYLNADPHSGELIVDYYGNEGYKFIKEKISEMTVAEKRSPGE